MPRIIAFLLCCGLWAGAAEGAKFQEITVRPGDTLWSIANKYLKDPQRWNVIVQHNRMPTKELTVPLPGMTLKVPIEEIKEDLRAAKLVLAKRKVLQRKSDSADWGSAKEGGVLYNGEGLRTLEESWARVEFFSGTPLSLEPNSMAILKAPKKADHDLFLKRGAVQATLARVITPSARIMPKSRDTKYTARVADDLTTKVQVFKGAAEVQDAKGLKTIEVRAGFSTEVALDKTPSVPTKIPRLDEAMLAAVGRAEVGLGSEVQVRRGGASPTMRGVDQLAADLKSLSVGIPIAAYQVQAARDQGFKTIVLDKRFDAYETIDLKRAGLPDGKFWVRVAMIDLLGDVGKFSIGRPYRSGAEQKFESLAFQGFLEITRPDKEEIKTDAVRYNITGRAQTDLTLRINGERIGLDEEGNFSYEAKLKPGVNEFRIEAADVRGNDTTILRRILRGAQQ
ncbi:MAG: hypothetical protein A2X36_00760 [Elusimicrobia bacterium GWA2_69_24]|nr:MAG: hypothetical protein A2X36_00760 [Elusimicrobia bacterium GWA2_69_24]HBL17836.1 hypothetical protein [Elusimicrobiota bacterium]